MFERILKIIFNIIFRCPQYSDRRVKRMILSRKNGVYSTIAGFIGVIEPQKDGRLHAHISIYNSIMTGSILSKVVINDNLKKIAKEWIDSICHTYLSDETHKWIESFGGEIPKRDFSLFVKDITNDFNPYKIDCEKKTCSNKYTFSWISM